MLDRYLAQVRLLLSVLPEIAPETAFALKGGTAINLFYRDLPRLSVDLDLTWVPVANRRSSLREIDDALDRITAAIARRYSRFDARRVAGGGGSDTRIMVSGERTQVKIETSPVTRGTVYPTRSMPASDAVIERFGFVEANVLAFDQDARQVVPLGIASWSARHAHAPPHVAPGVAGPWHGRLHMQLDDQPRQLAHLGCPVSPDASAQSSSSLTGQTMPRGHAVIGRRLVRPSSRIGQPFSKSGAASTRPRSPMLRYDRKSSHRQYGIAAEPGLIRLNTLSIARAPRKNLVACRVPSK